MKLARAEVTSTEANRDVSVHDRILQDFRPLTRCLEWELSELYWNSDGVLAFVGERRRPGCQPSGGGSSGGASASSTRPASTLRNADGSLQTCRATIRPSRPITNTGADAAP